MSIILSKKIENVRETEVLVIGGGPAGMCAAIASGRMGRKTMLVEQNGFCGGMATAAMVGPFMTCYDASGERMLIAGLFKEIVDRMVKDGYALDPSTVPTASGFTSYIGPGHLHVTPFEAEGLKRVVDTMLCEAKVQVKYHTHFVEPIVEKNVLRGVILFSKSGFEAVKARVVIDCSGDADIAFRSGVPVRIGSDDKGKMQPATMFFKIGNVDSDKVDEDIEKNKDKFHRKDGVNYRSFHWRVSEAREKGDWNLKRVSLGMFRSVKKDQWCINTSRIMGVDGTNSDSLSYGEIEGRRQVEEIFRMMKKYVPGCENATLLTTASQVGIRETRHIEGERTLTVEDILEGRRPPDSVFMSANSIDVHGKYGPMSNEYIAMEEGKWYGVPYGCLVPKKVENLLVAGRSISAEPDAAGAVRVMPPCMAMGQAAGVAATIAIGKNVSVRDVNVQALRDELKSQNVFLEQE